MNVRLKKPRRASGTRTMLDVLLGRARGSAEEQKRKDLESVRMGEIRIVRCYVKPDTSEHRRQWKPGYLHVSATGAVWKGSSRRFSSIALSSRQWTTNLRKVGRDEHVYKSFCVIECERGSEHYSFAVPRRDTELCLRVLSR
jgi:hypothetical protein